MRVQFTRDYDHVDPLKTVSYAKGAEETVSKEIGEAAIAAGAAKEVGEKKAEAPPAKSNG
jgi:hypothetical protein